MIAALLILAIAPSCGSGSSGEGDEAAKDLCATSRELFSAADLPDPEAADVYRSAAADIDAAIESTDSAPFVGAIEVSRLRGLASMVRSALIGTQTGNDDERRRAEQQIGDTLAELSLCGG